MKTTLLAIGLGAAAAMASPALAVAEDKTSATIYYADLDLLSEDGQRELERRIDRAARSICNSELQRTGTRIRNSAFRECQANIQAQLERRMAAITNDQRRGG